MSTEMKFKWRLSTTHDAFHCPFTPLYDCSTTGRLFYLTLLVACDDRAFVVFIPCQWQSTLLSKPIEIAHWNSTTLGASPSLDSSL